MESLHAALSAKISLASAEPRVGSGLIGVQGGVHVKLLTAGPHHVLLPIPQLIDDQVPLCFYIRSIPVDAAVEYRIQKREERNDVIIVKLKGSRNQEIQLEWSSVVLVANKRVLPNDLLLDSYRITTACVQSDSAKIKEVADELWPESNTVADYALGVAQGF